jgi:hypothetical protein
MGNSNGSHSSSTAVVVSHTSAAQGNRHKVHNARSTLASPWPPSGTTYPGTRSLDLITASCAPSRLMGRLGLDDHGGGPRAWPPRDLALISVGANRA